MATFAGSVNDIKSQWFASNGGGPSNDLNTQWYKFLSAKGRTGSINDMYRAELIASLAGVSSNPSITDLEKMFYSTSTNTFA